MTTEDFIPRESGISRPNEPSLLYGRIATDLDSFYSYSQFSSTFTNDNDNLGFLNGTIPDVTVTTAAYAAQNQVFGGGGDCGGGGASGSWEEEGDTPKEERPEAETETPKEQQPVAETETPKEEQPVAETDTPPEHAKGEKDEDREPFQN